MSRSPHFSSTRGRDLVNLCTVPLGFGAFSYILPRTPTQGHSARCVPGHKHNPCKEEGGVVGSCEPLQVSWPSVAQGGLRLKSRCACSAYAGVPQLKGIIHTADTDDLSVLFSLPTLPQAAEAMFPSQAGTQNHRLGLHSFGLWTCHALRQTSHPQHGI